MSDIVLGPEGIAVGEKAEVSTVMVCVCCEEEKF